MAQGKWKDAWSSAKDEFKDLTKEKKPDSAKLLGLVSKHKSGVAKALGTVDAAWLAYTTAVTQFGNGKQPEAKVYDALNVYGRAVKAGQKAIADYSGTLDAEIGKLKSKDDKELRYKGLKAMARTLAAIQAEFELAQTELFNKFNLEVAVKAREAKQEAKLSPDEMMKISTDPIITKSLLTGCAKMKAFLAKAGALAKKTPADLTQPLSFYNDNIQKAARDLTQPLGNTVKRLKMTLPGNIKTAETDMVARNGGAAKLPDNTDLRGYLAELKLLAGHTKVVETWAKTL